MLADRHTAADRHRRGRRRPSPLERNHRSGDRNGADGPPQPASTMTGTPREPPAARRRGRPGDPFMLRIAELVGTDESQLGELDTLAPMPMTHIRSGSPPRQERTGRSPSAPLAEQLVCEANAVLATPTTASASSTRPSQRLAFAVGYRGRAARVSMTFEDGTAYGRLVGTASKAESCPRSWTGRMPDLLVRLMTQSGLRITRPHLTHHASPAQRRRRAIRTANAGHRTARPSSTSSTGMGTVPPAGTREGTIDIQAMTNFYHRPLWGPDKESLPDYSVLKLTDPSFRPPPVLLRGLCDEPGRHARGLRVHAGLPGEARHVRPAPRGVEGPLPGCRPAVPALRGRRPDDLPDACRFGWGTTTTQCFGYAASDRIGNAQILSPSASPSVAAPLSPRCRQKDWLEGLPSRGCASTPN